LHDDLLFSPSNDVKINVSIVQQFQDSIKSWNKDIQLDIPRKYRRRFHNTTIILDDGGSLGSDKESRLRQIVRYDESQY